jgi:hypothetical protein
MGRRAMVQRIGLLAVASAVALSGVATPALAAPAIAVSHQQNQPTKLAQTLVRQVTADGANRHLRAFQRIADQNGGSGEHTRVHRER